MNEMIVPCSLWLVSMASIGRGCSLQGEIESCCFMFDTRQSGSGCAVPVVVRLVPSRLNLARGCTPFRSGLTGADLVRLVPLPLEIHAGHHSCLVIPLARHAQSRSLHEAAFVAYALSRALHSRCEAPGIGPFLRQPSGQGRTPVRKDRECPEG